MNVTLKVKVVSSPYIEDGYRHIQYAGQEWDYKKIEDLYKKISHLRDIGLITEADLVEASYDIIMEMYVRANNPEYGSKEAPAWTL